jgi:hypothetical protein
MDISRADIFAFIGLPVFIYLPVRPSIHPSIHPSTYLFYGLDDQGPIPSRGNDGIFFLFATASRQVLGPTQTFIQWVPGTLFRGGKAAGA